MRTYVMEEMPDLFWERIRDLKLENNFSYTEDFSAKIAIIRTKVQFRKELIDKFHDLKMIIRAGSGFDNIDVHYAKSLGIAVCNTPEANAFSAYEHTISLILAMIKNIQTGKDEILKNNWKSEHPDNLEFADLKVLVVGLGRVGTRVANAMKLLGAEVKAVDPYLTKSDWKEKGISSIPYIKGLDWCNLVTYHCPLFAETFHYFSLDTLELLNKPIWLVNVARGKVVEFQAVVKGLGSNMLRGVALDVFEDEPSRIDGCMNDPRLIMTPHTGAYSIAAKDRMSLETLDVWSRYVYDSFTQNSVNEKFIWKTI